VLSTRRADNLTAICKPIFYKMWEPRRLTTLWNSAASYKETLTFSFTLPQISMTCLLNLILRFSLMRNGTLSSFSRPSRGQLAADTNLIIFKFRNDVENDCCTISLGNLQYEITDSDMYVLSHHISSENTSTCYEPTNCS
jgi:hypothetical protein